MTWLWLLLAVSASFSLGWRAHEVWGRHPYRSRCHVEGCLFTASATDMRALDILATAHARYHQEDR